MTLFALAIAVTGSGTLLWRIYASSLLGKAELGLLIFGWCSPCAIVLWAWTASVATAASASTATSFATFARLTHLTGWCVGALFTCRCGCQLGLRIGPHGVFAFAVVLALGTATIAVAAFIALRAWAAFRALFLTVAVGCCRVQVTRL